MREWSGLILQIATVALLGLILLRQSEPARLPASDPVVDLTRLERLTERLIQVSEHNGDQLYLICEATHPTKPIYGPACEALQSEVLP